MCTGFGGSEFRCNGCDREMALDDGRFLISSERFDKLLLSRGAQALAADGLLRTHHNFRVISLGVPVPAYPGFPLDPPLRSRFQARFVDACTLMTSPGSLSMTLAAVNSGLVRLARHSAAQVSGASSTSAQSKHNPVLHLLPVSFLL